MFNNILLPIDLNYPPSWEKTLPMATKLCGAEGTLHVLGIVHEIGSTMIATYLPSDFETQALSAMAADLEGFVAAEVPAGTRSMVHVGHGHVAEQIVEHARKVEADIIVMASHPPNEFRTLLVGSNADRVVHHADRPVLVMR